MQPEQEVSPSNTHTHLSSKDAADTNDAKDVEDGRANDGPHPHIAMGDEDTCTQETAANQNQR